MAKVLVLKTILQGRCLAIYGFTKQKVTVGRSRTADLRLDHPGVSRQHLEIERVGDEFILRDSSSSNGTLVNSTRTKSCSLTAGDLVQVGKVVVQVSFDDASEDDSWNVHMDKNLDPLPTVRVDDIRIQSLPAE